MPKYVAIYAVANSNQTVIRLIDTEEEKELIEKYPTPDFIRIEKYES